MDSIICFGEILWDVLPSGRYPGGAPFNVAYHLHRLGARVVLASAVGSDGLGRELLERLAAWGIDTGSVTLSTTLPTGTVEATLGATGDARYRIAAPVAWDAITVDGELLTEAGRAKAVVFGSLALREEHNRRALESLLDSASSSTWRVFDVNLRAPHVDLALVGRYAQRVDLLKLNSAEAARIAEGAIEQPGLEEEHARVLASRTGARCVCVTAGERGAGLLRDGHWSWEAGRCVRVVDTVGAGDAFLARLLRGLVAGEGAASALAGACRLGEWVASRQGVTPDYDASAPIGTA